MIDDAGVLINVKVRQTKLTLKDAFPHWHYWKQLPGLVKDGCAFSFDVAQKTYYEKVLGTAPPMDSSLKKRLADNVDGGDGT